MRKRYYIIFVARQEDGDLRKIPIPLHYAYVFVAAAVIGLFTITGLAGSYSRMLLKTARFNQIRTERETIRHDYLQMEQVAHEKDVQAASLGSLASEVSALYGLRQNKLSKAPAPSATTVIPQPSDGISDQQYSQSLDQLLGPAFLRHVRRDHARARLLAAVSGGFQRNSEFGGRALALAGAGGRNQFLRRPPGPL